MSLSVQEWQDTGNATWVAEQEARQRVANAAGPHGTSIMSKDMAKMYGFSTGSDSASGSASNAGAAQSDPWSRYRSAAGDQLANMDAAGDPSQFYVDRLKAMSTGQFNSSDPSYQFRLQQGQQTAERSLASKGLLNSGNAAIELQELGQQSASQEYGAQFNRMLSGMQAVSQQHDTIMQRLMKMAGVDMPSNTAQMTNIAQQNADSNRISAIASGRKTSGSGYEVTPLGSGGSASIDTNSLFAGKASRDVYSANWWANDADAGSPTSKYGNGGTELVVGAMR